MAGKKRKVSEARAPGLFALDRLSLIRVFGLNDKTEVKSLSYQSTAKGGNAHIPHMELKFVHSLLSDSRRVTEAAYRQEEKEI